MNVQAIKENRFVRNFVRDKWLILGAMGIVLAFAAAYLLLLYKPAYTSTAKVWIKDLGVESYITGAETQSQLKPLTNAGNPVLTQMKILESREMEQFLANYIQGKDTTRLVRVRREDGTTALRAADNANINAEKPNTKGILEADMEAGTDIIEVSLTWDDPVQAQQLLTAALNKYQDMNLGINRDIRSKKRTYLDGKLTEVEGQLNEVRDQLRDFEMGNLAGINMDAETEELIKLKSQLVAQYEDALAAKNSAAGNVGELQSQLRMTPRQAINAVALGSGNESLVKMRSDLAELRNQYDHDAVKLAPTNPKMVGLKNQIASIERQIRDEESASLGGGKAGKARIYDGVRENLVEAMSTERARMVGLGSQAASLKGSLDRVNQQLAAIPESKYALENLKQEEKALALAYDELRKQQIEAGIQEAQTPSNIFVVDTPSLPEDVSFPKAWHLLALAMLLGAMTGVSLSVVKTYSDDLCEGVEAIENALGTKVLGIIPWMHRPVEASRNNVLSMNDIAYKNIASNLRIQGDRQGARTIAFTSSALRKSRTSTLHTLARQLTKQGDSVALIDADFRNPRLYKKHIFTKPATMELSDLITNINSNVRDGNFVHPQEVLSAMAQDQHGIHMAFNTHSVDDAYDYFASRGFRMMLDIIQENFDWVLIDTPSASIAPEFMVVSHKSDGVVMFVEHGATHSKLRRIATRMKEAQLPLLGAVIRDNNTDFEKDHEEFTRWRGGWKDDKLIPAATGTHGVAGTVPMQRVEFMGANIDALTMEETIDRVQEIIDNGERVQHVVVNVAKLVMMQSDAKLRKIVNDCELINADGAGVVLGAQMMGLPIPERITGTDLMENLMPVAEEREYRVFFFGAEEEVVRDVIAVYRRQYPNLKVAGFRNGYFAPYEERLIAEEIRDAKPDMLFVGFSSPKKEEFLSKWRDVMDVPFVMGVGGSFDVVAGKVRRAPVWMQDNGLEWFHRLLMEPGRMWKRYLVTNSVFGWMLMSNLLTGKSRTASN